MTASSKAAIALVALVIALSGCLFRSSDDLEAYHRYNECGHTGCFNRLSSHEKTSVFFGAMKIHPPDLSIEEKLADQSIEYLLSLKKEIERRGGSYEAYSFVSAVKIKRQRGGITEEHMTEMDLPGFCRNRDIYNMCDFFLR